jgi:acetyl esterase/lipase
VPRWGLFLAPWAVLGLCLVPRLTRPDWGPRADADFSPPRDLRVEHYLEYARYGDRVLHLTLYRPAKVSRALLPTVIVMRGGGFQHGDNQGFAFIAASLAQASFAAACIQYRTTAVAGFPAPIEDAKAAVRWVRANAATYRLDPDAIGAIGGSAGGYLAAFLATTAGVADLEGNGGNAAESSRIGAAVAMATAADFVDLKPYPREVHYVLEAFIGAPIGRMDAARRAASPVSYVTRTSAPLLLIHSDSDPSVPYAQARMLQQRYAAAGADAELITVSGGPHDPWNYTRWFPDLMSRSAAFLKSRLAAHRHQTSTLTR